ncbi:MAG: AAA family ATPase [Rubrivivax sp.]|nr:AAA family ATPase [Rubrivivax sp.]
MTTADATTAPDIKVVGARTFLQRFKPLETIVDGLPTPRGGVVSVTGPTGAGKTTVMAGLAVALKLGRLFAGREVTQGSVLWLAGENPDDFAMHLLATVQHLGLTPGDLSSPVDPINLWVVPGTFSVLDKLDYLDDVVAGQMDNVVAVFVDTSAAFFTGPDENDNVAMRRHASILRELATLPGRPTVFVLCHPVKSANGDNLIPRGGGAFLAEVDANLTLHKDAAGIVTLHWAGKIRGTTFDPIRFELVPVELQGHVDCRGKPIHSTAAVHIPAERAEALENKALDDENRLLIAMTRKPGASVADLAMAAGMTVGGGTPNKSKVHRLLQLLQAQGLTKKNRAGFWSLTGKGREAANELP